MKFVFTLLCMLTSVAAAAPLDTQLQPITHHYLAIQDQLAKDGLTDVKTHARAIKVGAAKLDVSAVTEPTLAPLKALPTKLATAAAALEAATDLKSARDAFKALSKPLALWVALRKPAGFSVVYCPMAKGSWVQASTSIRNPYHGASMLTCGEIVDGEGKGIRSGHLKR